MGDFRAGKGLIVIQCTLFFCLRRDRRVKSKVGTLA